MSPIRTVYWEQWNAGNNNAGSAVNAGNGDGGATMVGRATATPSSCAEPEALPSPLPRYITKPPSAIRAHGRIQDVHRSRLQHGNSPIAPPFPAFPAMTAFYCPRLTLV
jgi:hypothetical protein